MSKYIFKYNSLEEEKHRVKDTEKNLGFLKNQKIYFTLPKKNITDEYDEIDYKETSEYIESVWLEKEKEFDDKN